MFFKKKPYKVKLKGRSGIEYFEGDKKMLISSEFMAGSNGIVIYSDSIKAWNAPNEKELISDVQRKAIQHNITEDLKGHGIPVEWA